MLTKKRGGNRKKERCTRYASLCGGGVLPKALGSVAFFLANGILYRTNDKEARAKFQTFRRSVPVLPFSLPVAKRCATLREQLKTEQKLVKSRALDLMNAAIALEHDLTLVTRNVEDYKDIPELQLYPLAA
jgi:predicted nucleic acid-binding protein